MLSFFAHKNERRELRRRVTLACRVVRESDFRLIGSNALDLSPDGMLVMAIRDAEPGENLVVSFRATELGIWFDAEATVARVVRGRRPKDRGRCIGLRFTQFDPVSRLIPARPPSPLPAAHAAAGASRGAHRLRGYHSTHRVRTLAAGRRLVDRALSFSGERHSLSIAPDGGVSRPRGRAPSSTV